MYDNDIVPQYAITEPFTSLNKLSTMSYNIIVITSLVVQHTILCYRDFTSMQADLAIQQIKIYNDCAIVLRCVRIIIVTSILIMLIIATSFTCI